MKTVVIIDGYNVIHKVQALARHLSTDLHAGRQALIRCCRAYTSGKSHHLAVCVVFDGDSSAVYRETQQTPYLRVVYSKSGETADERILALLREKDRGAFYVVVSDDKEVIRAARDLRAEAMSAREFHAAATRQSRARREATQVDEDALSPLEQREITEGLKKEWGID